MNKITEANMEKYIFSKVKDEQAQMVIKRIYLAGMKILFSPQTHDAMMQDFMEQLKQGGHDVGSVLGADIAHIMIMMYGLSKGTMPLGALIPAGTMLLAKVTEFLNDTGTAQVSDQDFANASHMLATVLQSKFDPKFAQQVTPNQGTMPAQPTGMLGS